MDKPAAALAKRGQRLACVRCTHPRPLDLKGQAVGQVEGQDVDLALLAQELEHLGRRGLGCHEVVRLEHGRVVLERRLVSVGWIQQ